MSSFMAYATGSAQCHKINCGLYE